MIVLEWWVSFGWGCRVSFCWQNSMMHNRRVFTWLPWHDHDIHCCPELFALVVNLLLHSHLQILLVLLVYIGLLWTTIGSFINGLSVIFFIPFIDFMVILYLHEIRRLFCCPPVLYPAVTLWVEIDYIVTSVKWGVGDLF